MNPFRILLLLCPVAGLALGPVACDGGGDQDQVRKYVAPKDPPKMNHPPVGMGGRQRPQPQQAGGGESKIHWSVPEGWREIAPRPMSTRSYALNEAAEPLVLTVSEMGQQELLPNVNRWRQQLGMPGTTEAELVKSVTTKEIAGLKAEIVDLAGADKRTLGAILSGGGKSWVFKIMGAADQVAAQKGKFEAFLDSVHLDGPEGHGGHPAPTPPSADAATYALSGWELPAGWRHDPAPRSMRDATFFTAPEGGAEVAISRLRKEIMAQQGARDNVDMWRGQVGLGPMTANDAPMPQEAQVGQRPGFQFDIAGPGKEPGKPMRVIVAVTMVGEEALFVKMIGPDEVVKAQAEPFKAFLKSLRLTPQAQPQPQGK